MRFADKPNESAAVGQLVEFDPLLREIEQGAGLLVERFAFEVEESAHGVLAILESVFEISLDQRVDTRPRHRLADLHVERQ